MKTAKAHFGVASPTCAVHHPTRQRVVIVPKTTLAEMEEMVLQGKWVPWGLFWEGEVPADSVVAMGDVESRWQQALAREEARICGWPARASTAGTIVAPTTRREKSDGGRSRSGTTSH